MDNIFLIALLLLTFIAYYPARNLFFRNDEWEQITFIEKALNSRKALWSYIKGTEFAVVKHFIPFGHLSYFLRYYFCRDNFSCHFLTNLSMHLINVVLIYFIAMILGIDQYTALFIALLFAFVPVMADTIFWPIMSLITLSTMFILISIITHPAISTVNIFNFSMFIISLILAALTMEFGILASCLAFGIFLIYGSLDLYAILICLLPIAMYFIGRRLIIGSFSLSKGQKTPLIGVSKTLSNIYTGIIKLLLSNFAAVFNKKATDTLYILKPNLKRVQTLVSLLLLIAILITIIVFFFNNEIDTVKKWLLTIFLAMISGCFLMVSFGVEKSNPNPDLPHQMPRFYYLPAAIIALVIGLSLNTLPPWKVYIYLAVSTYIVIRNTQSIRQQISLLKTHTDSLREDATAFIETGLMPQRQVISCIDDYRLDWSFNEFSVAAYYRLGIKDIVDTHEGLNKSGEEEFWNGNYEKAKALFIKSILLNPLYVVPYNNLGVLSFKLGEHDLSSRYFIRGISLAPNDKELAVNFIYLLMSNNAYESAEAICRFSIKHSPNDEELLGLLSVIRFKRDNK